MRKSRLTGRISYDVNLFTVYLWRTNLLYTKEEIEKETERKKTYTQLDVEKHKKNPGIQKFSELT